MDGRDVVITLSSRVRDVKSQHKRLWIVKSSKGSLLLIVERSLRKMFLHTIISRIAKSRKGNHQTIQGAFRYE